MKRAIPVAVIAVLAIGAGVYLLTRPSADVELRGGYATRAWGGAEALDTNEAGAYSRFKGTGTVVAVVQAANPTDEAIELAVPDDATGFPGLELSVAFIPAVPPDSFPKIDGDDDLTGVSTTMPARAQGEIVHVFRVVDCKRTEGLGVPKLTLEADGHPAQV